MGEEGGSDGRQRAVLLQHVGILPKVSAQASCLCGFIERVGRARGIVILFPEQELDSDSGYDVEQRASQVSYFSTEFFLFGVCRNWVHFIYDLCFLFHTLWTVRVPPTNVLGVSHSLSKSLKLKLLIIRCVIELRKIK